MKIIIEFLKACAYEEENTVSDLLLQGKKGMAHM